MNSEVLSRQNPAEAELRRILEVYQESPLSTWETYEYYGVGKDEVAAKNRELNKTAFMNGEIRNPKLSYPALLDEGNAKTFIDLEHLSLDLMKDVTALNYDPDRETAAYDILRLRYLEMAMLQVSQRFATGEVSDEEQQRLAELFNVANDEIHGPLSSGRFHGLLIDVVEESEELLAYRNVPEELRSAAEYILVKTKPSKDQATSPHTPKPEVVEILHELVSEHDADLLTLVPKKPHGEELTLEEFVAVFEAAHDTRQTGWSVVVDENSSVSTNQSDKTTHIGVHRKRVNSTEASKLLIHENGVHVQRRVDGDKLNDPLLGGTGLAGYLASEEGLATILEDAVDGALRNEAAGIQYYLALGWARGLDGQARDFRDVYELEWRRRFVRVGVSADKSDIPEILSNSKKQAWTVATRVFRGTPCDIPGMVYTKDQAYFVGNQDMWEYISDMVRLPLEQRRQVFSKLYKAKFDPTNPLHNRIVDKAIEGARK